MPLRFSFLSTHFSMHMPENLKTDEIWRRVLNSCFLIQQRNNFHTCKTLVCQRRKRCNITLEQLICRSKGTLKTMTFSAPTHFSAKVKKKILRYFFLFVLIKSVNRPFSTTAHTLHPNHERGSLRDNSRGRSRPTSIWVFFFMYWASSGSGGRSARLCR